MVSPITNLTEETSSDFFHQPEKAPLQSL